MCCIEFYIFRIFDMFISNVISALPAQLTLSRKMLIYTATYHYKTWNT